MARFNALGLIGDQFRSMRNARSGRAALLVRTAVIVVPILAAIVSAVLQWRMNSTGALVGALGLLAGVFISAFAVVFGLRAPYSDRPSTNLNRRAIRLLDESALTLLAAGAISGVDAVWLAVVDSITLSDKQVLVWQTSVTVYLSTLVSLYFLLAVRRLHVLYTDTFPPEWRLRPDSSDVPNVSLDEAVKSRTQG